MPVARQFLLPRFGSQRHLLAEELKRRCSFGEANPWLPIRNIRGITEPALLPPRCQSNMEPDPVVCSILNSPRRSGTSCALRGEEESTGNWTRFPWDLSDTSQCPRFASPAFPWPVLDSTPRATAAARMAAGSDGSRPAAASNGRSTQHATSFDRCGHFQRDDRPPTVFSGPNSKAHLRAPSGFHSWPAAKVRNRPCHSPFAISHPTWHRAPGQRQHVG